MKKLSLREIKQIIIDKKKSAASDLIYDQNVNNNITKAVIKGEIMAYTDVLSMLECLEDND